MLLFDTTKGSDVQMLQSALVDLDHAIKGKSEGGVVLKEQFGRGTRYELEHFNMRVMNNYPVKLYKTSDDCMHLHIGSTQYSIEGYELQRFRYDYSVLRDVASGKPVNVNKVTKTRISARLLYNWFARTRGGVRILQNLPAIRGY